MKYDFDVELSRIGTHTEKYDSRKSLFGKEDVEPFWVADMDLPTPRFIAEALSQRVSHNMFGYTTTPPSLLSAIQWWQQSQHDTDVDIDWIRLSPSVVTSIAVAIQALTRPGDRVVVVSPVYGPFFFVTRQNNREAVDLPMVVKDNRYFIDFDALETCFQKDRPKLILLCNPHNPGGRVWTRDELKRLVELCTHYGVKLFSDEIHCDVVYGPTPNTSVLQLEEAKNISIVAHSIGKTFNTSGLNASFVIIPNEDIRKQFVNAQEDSHCGGVNLLGKVALETALSPAGVEFKTQLNAYLHQNVKEAVSGLRQISKAQIMMPESTFLVWGDFRAFGKWPSVMKTLIHEANVALSGGTFFGPAGHGWFRLNIACPRQRLLNAVDRIVNVL